MVELNRSRSHLVFCSAPTYQLDLAGPLLIGSVTVVTIFVWLIAILVVFSTPMNGPRLQLGSKLLHLLPAGLKLVSVKGIFLELSFES